MELEPLDQISALSLPASGKSRTSPSNAPTLTIKTVNADAVRLEENPEVLDVGIIAEMNNRLAVVPAAAAIVYPPRLLTGRREQIVAGAAAVGPSADLSVVTQTH